MLRHAGLLAIVLVPCLVGGLGRAAVAQGESEEIVRAAAPAEAPLPVPPEYGPPPGTDSETDPAPPPIPPNSEGAAFSVPGGGYCYVGPHPVDTRSAGGGPWDETSGAHMHAYPPLDLRLFELRDGCYYFVGDPRDFGYAGPTYSYYGAHPILDVYGGGWCFMIGPHTHLWRPWSSNFALVGPWYYWEGPYDPFFWSYWPYYSFYYRSYYPHYYGGGRFPHGGYGVAPPIHRVPPPSSRIIGSTAAGSPGWRASSSVHPGNSWRVSPSASRPNAAPVPPAAGYRAATPAAPYRAAVPTAPAGHDWSGFSGGSAGAARPSAPSFSAPAARSLGGGCSRGGGGGGFSRGGGGRRR